MSKLTRRPSSGLLAGLVALVVAGTCPSAAHAAGLLAPTDQTLPPLRVTDHLVDVKIVNGVAVTNVTQTFRNDTKQRLEATYLFPLPEDADLTDFQMTFNGKMVRGEVLPAEQAAQVYESIVRQLKDPGLIEFIGRRLLKMRIFPIEPESETTIKLRYQQICQPVSGMTGYHYPLRTRKTAGQAYGTVRFNVELGTAVPLKNIWSPTHSIEVVRGSDERTAHIAYEASQGSLEDDFLLLYATDDSDVGLSVVAHQPGDEQPGHFVLMLTPRQLWPETAGEPQDVVFVIDTSGSMAGDKLKQAKSALKYCIDRLDERDRFSVVRFSTGFDMLFDEPREASAEARGKARAWVDAFQAAGGTNIADTLHHVMAMRSAADEVKRPFVVVFLTDGRGNRTPPEILSAMGAAPAGVRIFPFGVGHDVNTVLLDGLASAFTGRTRYVQPGENLELVLGDFFSVISRPVLTGLHLSLPIAATERFPATLGDLYHGQQLVVAGRFTETASGSVKLSAMRGGQRVEYVWPSIKFTNTENADYVASVWAGRKIAYLIEQIRAHGESREMLAEVLALSQEYGIQTPYTSWLVNPEQPAVTLRGRPGIGGGAPGFEGRLHSRRASSPAVRVRLGQAAGGEAFNVTTADGAPTLGDIAVFGDQFYDIDLDAAAEGATATSGKVANLIARKNADLKEARSRDEGRLDKSMLAYRKIGGRWYHRMGRYLVDAAVGEETELVVVRFGSEAYFELVRHRKDLRAALATTPTVVLMVGDDVAMLVSDRTGTEAFDDEQRNRLGF
ncbi:MAG: VWA domain-containing protein [Planctomycetes bacterium]|nr:VWA domain-containing protein [Planctomycetota bacterium]